MTGPSRAARLRSAAPDSPRSRPRRPALRRAGRGAGPPEGPLFQSALEAEWARTAAAEGPPAELPRADLGRRTSPRRGRGLHRRRRPRRAAGPCPPRRRRALQHPPPRPARTPPPRRRPARTDPPSWEPPLAAAAHAQRRRRIGRHPIHRRHATAGAPAGAIGTPPGDAGDGTPAELVRRRRRARPRRPPLAEALAARADAPRDQCSRGAIARRIGIRRIVDRRIGPHTRRPILSGRGRSRPDHDPRWRHRDRGRESAVAQGRPPGIPGAPGASGKPSPSSGAISSHRPTSLRSQPPPARPAPRPPRSGRPARAPTTARRRELRADLRRAPARRRRQERRGRRRGAAPVQAVGAPGTSVPGAVSVGLGPRRSGGHAQMRRQRRTATQARLLDYGVGLQQASRPLHGRSSSPPARASPRPASPCIPRSSARSASTSRQTAGGLLARVTAETPAAAQALAAGHAELRQSLSSIGVYLARLDIGLTRPAKARLPVTAARAAGNSAAPPGAAPARPTQSQHPSTPQRQERTACPRARAREARRRARQRTPSGSSKSTLD